MSDWNADLFTHPIRADGATALLAMILNREGLGREVPLSVRRADDAVLAAERDHPLVVGGACAPWAELPEPANVVIECWPPARAKAAFIRRYLVLRDER